MISGLIGGAGLVAGCGAETALARQIARSACDELSDSDFDDLVDLARAARDADVSKEDWTEGLGNFCDLVAVDSEACARCTAAVGDYVWGF
jgi:hypothetical protein